MVSISNIKGSNGSGQAVRGAVTNARAISSTTLKVDSVTNYPSQFIATTGKLGPSGILDNTTVQVFFGHLSGADIIIDSFAPGYTDKGNSVADIVILKPTTAWADEVAGVLDVTHNDNGTIKNNAVKTAMLDAANIDASVALKDASVTSSKIDFTTQIWWEELGRASVSVATDSFTVSDLKAKKHLRILVRVVNSGVVDTGLRFNGDTGNNYAYNISDNGAVSTTGASVTFIAGQTGATANQYLVYNVTNYPDTAKQVLGMLMHDGANAAGTAPHKREVAAKWHNTTDQITSITVFNSNSGDLGVGTEIVVLGHD